MSNPFDQFDAPTANAFDQFDAPPPAPVSPTRVAGQAGIGVNDKLYQGVMALPDLSAQLTRYMGLTSPDTPLPSEGFRNWARSLGNERPADWEPQNKTEQVGRATGEGIGEAMNFMAPFGALSRVATVPSVVRSASSAMTAKPVLQGLSAATGSAVGEATDNPYLGLGASLAVPFGLAGAQRVASAAPALNTQEAERRALLQFGRDNDLGPLTAGKIIDSKKLQTYEGAINRMPVPFLGGRVKATEEAGRDAFQAANIEKAGITGETAWTPTVSERAGDKIGAQFDALTKNTTINVTPKFGNDLAGIKAEYGDRLFEDVQPGVVRRLDELAKAPAALSQPGATAVTLDGKTYQNIRSDLSRIAGTSTKPADRQAAWKMVEALDEMAGGSMPKDQMADWARARQQWRNKVALDKSVFGSNNAETSVGNIPVARFAKEAKGNSDLERLAQYGAKFVGDKMPYDTASRHTSGGVLGHGLTALAGGLTGAAGAHGGMELTPYTIAGAGAAAMPFAADMAMNNPLTRALLMARYRNPSQSIIPPGVYGSLAGQAAVNQPTR